MLIKLNFNLSAWIKELMIEADSEQDAINKLNGMSFDEIMAEEAVVDSEIEIKNITTMVVSKNLLVKVNDIEYDFSDAKLDPAVVDYLKTRLPKELSVRLTGVSEDDELEEVIKADIYDKTGYDVLSMNYEVIDTK